MGKKGEFYRKLRDSIFGGEVIEQKDRAAPAPETKLPNEAPRGEREAQEGPPRLWQIGLDFGTCFCKVVCRDLINDKATVYIPNGAAHGDLPFLIPSGVSFDGRSLRASRETDAHYVDGRLCHLKLALEQVALGNYGAEVLQPFHEVLGSRDPDRLASLVRAGTVYLLGGILGDVRREIRLEDPSGSCGAAAENHIMVNMAIPVADAQIDVVWGAYQTALQTAWVLADKLAGHPEMELARLTRLMEQARGSTEPSVSKACKACYVYPEVFANIQVFARSRASESGVYLFSDTGAGTVDQCVFHFIRHDGNPHTMYYPGSLRNDARYSAMLDWVRQGQNYLRAYSAFVLRLGSAEIERVAAGEVPADRRPQELERWRRLKEANSPDPRLGKARQKVGRDLKSATQESLRDAKRKGCTPEQLGPIRIVFGGGGHCRVPYAEAVRDSCPGADVVGLPLPRDLDLRGGRERWMSRLAVAYGLSFPKQELAKFTYPNELRAPPPPRPIRREVSRRERPRDA